MNEQQIESSQPNGVAFERHFTPKQLAVLWNLSVDVVRAACENDPDVVKIGHAEQLHKRKYVSLRIPASAAARIHKRLTKPVDSRPI